MAIDSARASARRSTFHFLRSPSLNVKLRFSNAISFDGFSFFDEFYVLEFDFVDPTFIYFHKITAIRNGASYGSRVARTRRSRMPLWTSHTSTFCFFEIQFQAP